MNLPVVLAEPHPVARAALTALLAQDGRLDVFRLSELGDALGGRRLWLATADRLPPGDRGDSAGMRLPAPLPAGTRRSSWASRTTPPSRSTRGASGAAAYVVKDRDDQSCARRSTRYSLIRRSACLCRFRRSLRRPTRRRPATPRNSRSDLSTLPGRADTASVAPARAMRSRMPSSPKPGDIAAAPVSNPLPSSRTTMSTPSSSSRPPPP
jgi:hypothetical protein